MALGWLWWRAWVPFGAVVAAAVCLAGVALGDIGLHFVWQAWHLATSTCILRGRRGTYGAGLALVARLGPICAVVVPLTLILTCLSHLPGGPETLCKLDCCGDILEV